MEDLSLTRPEPGLDTLIASTLAGEANDAELFVLRKWLGKYGIDLSSTRLPCDVKTLPRMPHIDIKAAWEIASERLERSSSAGTVESREGSLHLPIRKSGVFGPLSLSRGTSRGRVMGRGVWYALTGAVVGIIGIIAGWHVGTPRFGERGQVAMSVYVTGNGERAKITLPDGSTAALNVASRLEVPANYLAGNHTLRLTGEALFTVTHHDGTPFTVVAGLATARVLGTTFLVRHYVTDSVVTLAVRDGKISVHSAEIRSVVLTGAQQTAVGPFGSSTIQPADLTKFSFARGVLTLNNVSLSEAIAELDRWYDADIRLGDPTLKDQRVAGEYAAGSLSELTNILELTFNVRVVRNGRILTLFPR